jgi:DNA adenine methylase
LRFYKGGTLRPFLRWAGGKRKLAELITGCIPQQVTSNPDFHLYEPFVGGGAVMLHLGAEENSIYVPGSRLHINDMNPDLVMAYVAIQNQVPELMGLLDVLSRDLSKDAYLRIRAEIPNTDLERAARFIYLNKTGFNGLWRVNSKGLYNVPWGQLKSPTLYDRDNLFEISERIQGAEITHTDYRTALKEVKQGDLVYLDPPYIPLNLSSSFSKYAKDDFTIENQRELSAQISDLSQRSASVILSNSDTPETREIFGSSMHLFQIDAARAISAKASSRGTVKEIIAVNFELDLSHKALQNKIIRLN